MTHLDQFINELKLFYDGKPWYGSSFMKIVEDITRQMKAYVNVL